MGTLIKTCDFYDLMDSKQYKPFKLREQTVNTLQKNLTELQTELAGLRVNKVASGVASKLAKIKVVRKAIARVLTTVNSKKRDEMKEMYKDKKALKAFNEKNGTSYRFSDKPLYERKNHQSRQKKI